MSPGETKTPLQTNLFDESGRTASHDVSGPPKDVPVPPDQHVLRLEIAMDQTPSMSSRHRLP